MGFTVDGNIVLVGVIVVATVVKDVIFKVVLVIVGVFISVNAICVVSSGFIVDANVVLIRIRVTVVVLISVPLMLVLSVCSLVFGPLIFVKLVSSAPSMSVGGKPFSVVQFCTRAVSSSVSPP